MLVATANWALADGTIVSPPRRRQAEWLAAVHRAAIRAGFREDGRYRPIERIDVVLAGDTFDWLTSTAWTAAVRPWHGGARVRAARERVMRAAARGGFLLLSGLKRWARGGLAVPSADRRGRPVLAAEVRIPVAVTLLAGDRDRWLAAAAEAAGRSGFAVGETWSAGAVSVRHGAESDPLCVTGTFVAGEVAARDRQPTLGESLAVDLVARFGAALPRDPHAPRARQSLVAALAACRPLDAPHVLGRWLASARSGMPVAADEAEMVVGLWRRAVAAWWREARRTAPSCGVEFDPLDALAAWLDRAATDGRWPPLSGRDRELVERLADGPVACGEPWAEEGIDDQTRLDILGHPSAPAAAAACRRIVCLGCPPAADVAVRSRLPIDVACVGIAAGLHAGPTHAIFLRRGDSLGWHWMRNAADDAAAVCIPAGYRPSADGVVEAA